MIFSIAIGVSIGVFSGLLAYGYFSTHRSDELIDDVLGLFGIALLLIWNGLPFMGLLAWALLDLPEYQKNSTLLISSIFLFLVHWESVFNRIRQMLGQNSIVKK